MGDLLRFEIPQHQTWALMNYHRNLASNLEDASVPFKILFNFLTQSTADGPHRKALEAFNFLRMDFITRVNIILGDV